MSGFGASWQSSIFFEELDALLLGLALRLSVGDAG
jgi:hypothetical protein